MVGGDKPAYERVEPILRELGTPNHIGENGHGLVLKLAINISLAVQMLAFAEGLVMAERAGIDRKLAVEVTLALGSWSPAMAAQRPSAIDIRYPASGPSSLLPRRASGQAGRLERTRRSP